MHESLNSILSLTQSASAQAQQLSSFQFTSGADRVNDGKSRKRKPKASDRMANIEVRDSPVHGRGVFATKRICKGSRIIEYSGQRMSWEQASDDSDDPHTFLFGLRDGNDVINAAVNGNDSRWINHSCDPNCEAIERNGRIFIYALRDLRPGEELFYDYALEVEEPRTSEVEKQHACRCGTAICRATLLAPGSDGIGDD